MDAVVQIMGNKSSSIFIDDLCEYDEMPQEKQATQVLGKSFDILRNHLNNCGGQVLEEIDIQSDSKPKNRQAFANIKGNRKKGW